MSARKLRDLIKCPETPLPAYKIGGSIKVKKSDFDVWIEKFRLKAKKITDEQYREKNDIDEIVRDVMKYIYNNSS